MRIRLRALWVLPAAIAVALALTLLASVRPSTAEAHPLGNFTVNRYTRVELSPEAIDLRYVLDLAEIPAFQERRAIDTNGDGEVSEPERSAYAEETAERLRRNLSFTINGEPVDLRAVANELSFPPGQGGLDTQRLVVDYRAPMPDGWEEAEQRVEYSDGNFANRIGWREVVVRSLDGVRVLNSTAPAEDVSHELRAYPEGSIGSPLDVSSATFDFTPGAGTGASTSARPSGAVETAAGRSNDPFTSLVTAEELSLTFIAGALAVALAFGALHALGPGHGKAVVAAYLVGERGTARHALLLGLTVTATHTSSVFALGLGTLYASQFILPERLYPWLSLFSGLLVLGLGGFLLVSRVRGLRRRHDQRDGDAHGHSHALPGTNGPGVSGRSLLLLGISGGIVPCPSALVVLLGAISLHRVGLGLLLVVAFSVGLAATLTAIGLALVLVGRLAARYRSGFEGSRLGRTALAARLAQALPALSALAITGVGFVMIVRALGGGASFGV